MPELEGLGALDENAILKEVWNTQEIGAKTELSDDQIANVNKLKAMSMFFGNAFLDNSINTFMVLQKSRNRKSMSEFVDVVKRKFEQGLSPNGGFMGKMFG